MGPSEHAQYLLFVMDRVLFRIYDLVPKVGLETRPDRPDGPHSAGCIENQPWRLHLGPVRDIVLFYDDELLKSLFVDTTKVDFRTSSAAGGQLGPSRTLEVRAAS